MNIKEKILAIPFSYPDSMPQGEHPLIESYQNSCKIGFNRALTQSAEVAQAEMEALITEIDELVGIGQIVYCDQLITALDKWRTK